MKSASVRNFKLLLIEDGNIRARVFMRGRINPFFLYLSIGKLVYYVT